MFKDSRDNNFIQSIEFCGNNYSALKQLFTWFTMFFESSVCVCMNNKSTITYTTSIQVNNDNFIFTNLSFETIALFRVRLFCKMLNVESDNIVSVFCLKTVFSV